MQDVMKILLCHNHYQQRGGEDLSFASEADLLQARGHDVIRHTVHNDVLEQTSRLRAAAGTLWNRQSYRSVRSLLRREKPDVMHCTNTFPLLSPSVYYAAKEQDVPVVQSLRNYRLLCPGAYLLRGGRVCEDCLTKRFAWPGVWHGCYRGSRAASATVAAMSTVHHLMGTWRNAVDLFFTPTEFARQKFIQAGFPAGKIGVKPNFIDPDPGRGRGQGGYALFVGRLSEEKGIETMLEAWRDVADALPLKIVGDGPLKPLVDQAAQENQAVHSLGSQSHDEVLTLLGDAACLVMPSIWYETFGRTIVEAYAKGTPVLATRLGCMAELVEDDVTGLLFEPGNAQDLAEAVGNFVSRTAQRQAMSDAARAAYLQRYTAQPNYEMLMALYCLVKA